MIAPDAASRRGTPWRGCPTSMNAEPNIVNRKNLRRRVDALGVAPTADEEVHRHEHDLEEDEEQEQVEAEERSPSRRPRAAATRRGRASRRDAGRRPRMAEREQHARSARRGTARCRRRRGARRCPTSRSSVLAHELEAGVAGRRTTASIQTLSAPVNTVASRTPTSRTSSGRRFDMSATTSEPTTGTRIDRREDRGSRELPARLRSLGTPGRRTRRAGTTTARPMIAA